MVNPLSGIAKYALADKMPNTPDPSAMTMVAQKQQMAGDPFAGMYVAGNQMQDQGNYDRYLALRQIYDDNKKAQVDMLVAEAVKQQALEAAQTEAMARMKYGTMRDVANTQADARKYAADKSYSGTTYKTDASTNTADKANQVKKEMQDKAQSFKAGEGEKDRVTRLEAAKIKGNSGLKAGDLVALLNGAQ